jgi:hypothetical protein
MPLRWTGSRSADPRRRQKPIQRGWSPHLRRYQRRLPLAAGVGLIVGAGMAAFAPLFGARRDASRLGNCSLVATRIA